MSSDNVAVIEGRAEVAALLPPLRREILDQLQRRPDSATGLAKRLGLTRQKINYHVRELEKNGFLELDGEEKRRGCMERRFRPTARALLISPNFLGGLEADPKQMRDQFSSAYLISLAARMVRDMATLRRGADEAGKRLASFALEVDVRFRSPADRTAFAEELTAKVAELASRYQDDSPESRAYRFVIGGHPVVEGLENKGEQDNDDAENRDRDTPTHP